MEAESLVEVVLLEKGALEEELLEGFEAVALVELVLVEKGALEELLEELEAMSLVELVLLEKEALEKALLEEWMSGVLLHNNNRQLVLLQKVLFELV